MRRPLQLAALCPLGTDVQPLLGSALLVKMEPNRYHKEFRDNKEKMMWLCGNKAQRVLATAMGPAAQSHQLLIM